MPATTVPSDTPYLRAYNMQQWLKESAVNAGIGISGDNYLRDIQPSDTEGVRWSILQRWAALLAENIGGSGSTTLQAAYDASSDGEIVIDGTLGAVKIKAKETPDGSIVFEVTDFDGSTVYLSVDENGVTTVGEVDKARRPLVEVSGTTHQFALTDAGRTIHTTNAGAVTITVPANATVALPIGAEIEVIQRGDGQVTFAAAGGVTIESVDSALSIASKYGAVALKKISTDTWWMGGLLA